MSKVKVKVLKGQVDYSYVGDEIEIDETYVERLVNDGFVQVVEKTTKQPRKTKEKEQ
ncbi:hypothetical protein ABS754_001928 [Listeria monocytogenes]|nr:hypothetical protein [Listeria monocytogenes]MBC1498637.1 hypothetical protein [Listeria welshimeri]EEO2018216.1 hypothetical protein [Listeria monocytogenes]EEO6477018.1 hypothetical protein [Listeria monocytogenes]EGB2304064.1 hypothetical protein [Listeria monocytogenes]